jgi:signal transduction histidine kinase
MRAKPPSLWLAIEMVRLGPDSSVPYLACPQVIPRRRRSDKPSPSTVRRRLNSATGPAGRDLRSWPPLLLTLSHEFRGPLTAIRGWSRMAADIAPSPDTMSRALAVIDRNAASLSEMIENMFDLSRRATGSLALKRSLLDLDSLTQLVVESTLPAARERNVIVTLRRARSTLLVNGDSLRLEQVVRNLLDNAIKFTPAGGHVHVHTGCAAPFAEVVVTDNGAGISPDLLSAVFKPLWHDDAGVQPSERGLGLGLALVRELVQLHQGDVRALSEGKGRGSTFIVRLPLVGSAEVGTSSTVSAITTGGKVIS